MSKLLLERLHIEKYRFDVLARTGQLPFDTVTRGADPPDFRVQYEDHFVGLDASVVALPQRRSAYRLFDLFLERIREDGRDYSSLKGTLVAVWFGGGSGMPPRRTDLQLTQELAAMLSKTTIDRVLMRKVAEDISKTGFPRTFPPGYPIFQFPDNEGGFVVSELEQTSSNNEFLGKMGLDCVLQTAVVVDGPLVMSEVLRLIEQHDKPEIDWLILTIGGPDVDGWSYPGEDVMFELVSSADLVIAFHLKRVTVHRWSTGECTELQVSKPQPAR